MTTAPAPSNEPRPDADSAVGPSDATVETGPVGRRRPVAPFVAGGVLVVLVAFIALLATGDATTERGRNIGVLGQSAPPISGEILDGSDFALPTPPGEFVLVNFFATWCTPCVIEHPELVNFEQRHGLAGDARVVSVVFDSRKAQVQEFFDERGGDWPVVFDDDGSIAVSFGVSGMPESYLVAPNGIVLEKIVGGVTATQLDVILARYTDAA